MAITSAGEIWGVKAPTAGNTVEVPIVLTDSAGAVVTGVTWNAAGMAVWYSKPGDTNYTAFPTFATENWRELLLGVGGAASGEYRIILRQSDATELALLDTEGMMSFYVKCTATRGDRAMLKVNPADVVRDDQYTDARAARLDAAITSRSSHSAADVNTALIAAHGAGAWNKGGAIVLHARSLDITVEAGECVDGNGNIEVTRDDPTDIQWTWTDQVITGYTIYLTVREHLYSSATDDADAIFQVVAALTAPASGIFTFTIGKTETDECELEREYWYDISPFDADGNQEPTLIKARFAVTGDVTRRTSIIDP